MKKWFLVIFVIFLAGCQTTSNSLQEGRHFHFEIAKRTYEEILQQQIIPTIPKDFKFPISYQFKNGCFAFAVKHIIEYKYDKTLDLYEAEKIIDKPRDVLWDVDYITAFLDEYDIEMKWYRDAETFFKLLQQGEPLVIQYPYDIGNDKYIGHLVAAYSFDDEGVWVSESISGQHKRIDYSLVFGKTGKYTRYGFATVEAI